MRRWCAFLFAAGLASLGASRRDNQQEALELELTGANVLDSEAENAYVEQLLQELNVSLDDEVDEVDEHGPDAPPEALAVPEHLKARFSHVTFLKMEKHSCVYKATDVNGQKVLLKMLYWNHPQLGPMLLKWSHVKVSTFLPQQASETEFPCRVMQKLHSSSGGAARGAARFPTCTSNIPHDHAEDPPAGEDQLYMAFQDVQGEGQLLSDWLHKEVPAAQQYQLPIILTQLFEGLAALEAVQVVHHKLSPKHLWLSEANGEVKLFFVDLDSAARAAREVQFDLTEYSPLYAPLEADKKPGGGSPENFDFSCGAKCATAFDLYAAGVIYLELLCKRSDADPKCATAGYLGVAGGIANMLKISVQEINGRIAAAEPGDGSAPEMRKLVLRLAKISTSASKRRGADELLVRVFDEVTRTMSREAQDRTSAADILKTLDKTAEDLKKTNAQL